MNKKTADIVVKIFAILAWVGAGFSALMTLLLVILLFFIPTIIAETGIMGEVINETPDITQSEFATLLQVVLVLFILFLLGAAILNFFIGLGLWKYKNWARLILVVLSWIGVAFAILRFAVSFAGTPVDVIIVLLGVSFSLAINILEIWLFQFNEDVVKLFKE